MKYPCDNCDNYKRGLICWEAKCNLWREWFAEEWNALRKRAGKRIRMEKKK